MNSNGADADSIAGAMEPRSMMSSAVCVLLLVLHCCLAGTHPKHLWESAVRHLTDLRMPHKAFFGPADPRVDEAMQQLAVKNFILACGVLQHVSVAAVLTATALQDASHSASQFAAIATHGSTWIFYVTIANGFVQMSFQRVRAVFVCLYAMCVPIFCIDARADGLEFAVLQTVHTAGRCLFVLLTPDSKMHVPLQLCASFIEAASFLVIRGFCEMTLPYLLGLLFTTGIIITMSLALESFLRAQFEAQLKFADAESITSGFRRMLRGVCDGELLLDENRRIKEHSAAVSQLLCTPHLKGKSFQDPVDMAEHGS